MSINTNFNPIPSVSALSVPKGRGQAAAPVAAGNVTEQNISDVFETARTRPARDVDMAAIGSAINQKEQQVEAFRRLVERLLGKQGQTWVNAQGEAMVYVDEATRVRAEEEVAEGGYFSVEAVSERLLGFARAFAGDDPERIELMREAFLRGFAAAEQQWGGELPEISQLTFDAVMAGFDLMMNGE